MVNILYDNRWKRYKKLCKNYHILFHEATAGCKNLYKIVQNRTAKYGNFWQNFLRAMKLISKLHCKLHILRK